MEIRTAEIQDRVNYMIEIGIPKNLIETLKISQPTLWHKEEVFKKIEELKKLGFTDPVKMIISLPQIFGYNIEGIQGKIEKLKKLGFTDPVKMIISSPSILGFSIEKNIKPKLAILRKMIDKYTLPYTAVSLMESSPLFFSSKRDKIWVLIRILSSKLWADIDIMTRVSKLLGQNLESVLITNIANPNLTTIKELIQKSREVKVKHNTKEKEIIIRDQ